MSVVQPSSSLPTGSDPIGQHLQVVHSYFRDDDAVDGSLQKRAYSVGSKPPTTTTGKPPVAHSSGSYVDMSIGGGGGLLKEDAEKSCSAPHLNDEVWRPPAQSGVVVVGTEVSDLLMELDFNRKSSDSAAPTAAAVKDFRTRASSGGARDLGARKLSHNAKDALSRITFFHRGGASGGGGGGQDAAARRPRTSTICQESLRPRTSSFGTPADDSRPRSSSGGNTRLRDVFDGLHGVRHLAQQRRLASKRPSVESSADSLAAGAEYLDMMCGGASCSRSSTASAAAPTHQQQSDPYMLMRPGASSPKPSSDNSSSSERARTGIPAAGGQLPPDAAARLTGSRSAYAVDSADRKSTDVAAEVLSSASTSTSREVNLPAPFEVGISCQSLHYTAGPPCPPASTAVTGKPPVVTSASVAAPSGSSPTASPADVSYATLDIHGSSAVATSTSDAPARPPPDTLYRGGTPHAYAEIDFSQSNRKQ